LTGKYDNIIKAETSRITKEELCGTPANGVGWRDLGLIHTANFTGMLALSTQKLFYIFGDEHTNDFSKEYTFFVPPAPGKQPENRGTRLIIYDDLGRGEFARC
jgi:hypothetical protein